MKVGIIDYGSGNFSSVYNSLSFLGNDLVVVTKPEELTSCDKIILPGVGSFFTAMDRLRELSLIDALNKAVIQDKKPYLGICVGMQILAKKGFEIKEVSGLGWVNGDVNMLERGEADVSLPHIGWNDVQEYDNKVLFEGVNSEDPSFYFVHSYCLSVSADEDVEVTTTTHGKTFISAIRKNNIFGVQFHPEKSQRNGQKLLKNFVELNG